MATLDFAKCIASAILVDNRVQTPMRSHATYATGFGVYRIKCNAICIDKRTPTPATDLAVHRIAVSVIVRK